MLTYYIRLVLAHASGEQVASVALPLAWACAPALVPVLQVCGFGGMLALLPPQRGGEQIEQAVVQLEGFRRTGSLVDECVRARADPTAPLPLALVVGAWVLQQGGKWEGASDFEELLRSKCTSVCESSQQRPGTPLLQRLEVPGAAAMELSFRRVELAQGYGVRVSCDEDGNIPALATPAPSPLADGQITKYLVNGDYLYASLDNADPKSVSVGTQQTHLALPDGWEIAPSEPLVVSEIIAKHPWGTHVVVCANGNAYSTTLHELGRRAGQLFNSNRLSVQPGNKI